MSEGQALKLKGKIVKMGLVRMVKKTSIRTITVQIDREEHNLFDIDFIGKENIRSIGHFKIGAYINIPLYGINPSLE